MFNLCPLYTAKCYTCLTILSRLIVVKACEQVVQPSKPKLSGVLVQDWDGDLLYDLRIDEPVSFPSKQNIHSWVGLCQLNIVLVHLHNHLSFSPFTVTRPVGSIFLHTALWARRMYIVHFWLSQCRSQISKNAVQSGGERSPESVWWHNPE